MPTLKTATKIAAISLAAALSPSAVAQPLPPPPITAPSAWRVSADTAHNVVEIGSMAKDGNVRFVGGCNKLLGPGLIGAFAGYRGSGLRAGGEIERVLFYVRGAEWQEAFSAQLRYLPSSGTWEIVSPLSPVFVNSFSRGGTLTVKNAELQDLFSFDLTGSTAAARTMRSVCGFP